MPAADADTLITRADFRAADADAAAADFLIFRCRRFSPPLSLRRYAS